MIHNGHMIHGAQQTGLPVTRVEGRDKVTGRAVYTADTPFDDLVYAAVVQSEIPHGR